MKIVLINGQNHKGSTYNIGRMLAEKLGEDITEFFLPKDFGEFCIGCNKCFMTDAAQCPHYGKINPIIQAMDEAEVIILTSPVYVYHVTGSMKAFLDHFASRWMVHRPEEKMFQKQGVCITTAAGGGMKSANKDMADSMRYWGVAKIYKLGLAVYAISYEKVSNKIKTKIDKKTTIIAKRIKNKQGSIKPEIKTRFLFFMMRILHKKGMSEIDSVYWKEKGWTERKRPWK